MIRLVQNTIPDYTPFEKEDLKVFMDYKKMVFGLCWFHSLLNERKRFRSLGWNISYEFTDSDFLFCERILREMIFNDWKTTKEGLQWDSIKYLFGQINYGGRITDKWDQRLLNVYSKELFKDEMLSNPDYKLTSYSDNDTYRMIPED